MDGYILSEQAQSALEGVIRYTIAKFGQRQAERAVQQIFEAAERLALMPSIGGLREDLTEETVHFWTITKLGITLIYEPESSPLLIVHIVGPGQEAGELFD